MSHYDDMVDPAVLESITAGAKARLDALMAEAQETLRLQATDKPEPTLNLRAIQDALRMDQKRLAELQLAQTRVEERIRLLAEERIRLGLPIVDGVTS